MKFLFFIIACFSLNCLAQNYAGSYVHDYVGKQLKVIEIESKKEFGFSGFLKSINEKTNVILNESKDIAFYNKKTLSSDYSKLAGKIFTCDSVFLAPIQKGSRNDTGYLLKLKNPEIGTVYYTYRTDLTQKIANNPEMAYFFPFEVIGGLPNFYCNQISKTQSKFDSEIKNVTPNGEQIQFIQSIKNLDTTIFCMISIESKSIYNGEGVIILFDNGTKIEKPNEKIEFTSNSKSSMFTHSVIFELTKDEIKLFKKLVITDVKMYVMEIEIENGVKYSEFLKCLLGN